MGVKASSEHRKKDGSGMDVLANYVFINLSHNFDINASIDNEFDEALFTMALTEIVSDKEGEYYSDVSL